MHLKAWRGRAVGLLAGLLLAACATKVTVPVAAVPGGPTLADREAIEATLYRYARGLDRHDPDLYASAWAEDAVFDLGTVSFKGKAQMRGIITGLIESDAKAAKSGKPRPQIFHMDANGRVEFIASDHAIYHAYFFTISRTAAKGPLSTNTIVATGSTTDELKKIDGAWLIVKRTVKNDP